MPPSPELSCVRLPDEEVNKGCSAAKARKGIKEDSTWRIRSHLPIFNSLWGEVGRGRHKIKFSQCSNCPAN